jgi:hypothetical protein
MILNAVFNHANDVEFCQAYSGKEDFEPETNGPDILKPGGALCAECRMSFGLIA